MNRYEDTHVDDGMRHGGLVPSREERQQERVEQAFRKRIATLETQLTEATAHTTMLENEIADAARVHGLVCDDRKCTKEAHDCLRDRLAEATARAEKAEVFGGKLLKYRALEMDPEGDTEYQRVKRTDHNRDMDTRADAIAECHNLRDENARLREALLEVGKWDLNWADGLDSNVERIKHFVREALEPV